MVVAYGLVYLIVPIVLSQATIASYRMVAVIRQALTEAVYRKAVSATNSSKNLTCLIKHTLDGYSFGRYSAFLGLAFLPVLYCCGSFSVLRCRCRGSIVTCLSRYGSSVSRRLYALPSFRHYRRVCTRHDFPTKRSRSVFPRASFLYPFGSVRYSLKTLACRLTVT